MGIGRINIARVGISTRDLDQLPPLQAVELAAEAAAGAHPYSVPPEHTAIARSPASLGGQP